MQTTSAGAIVGILRFRSMAENCNSGRGFDRNFPTAFAACIVAEVVRLRTEP